MQETHSMKENEIRWNDDFNTQIHYFHGTSNSCGVFIAIFCSKTYTVMKKASDKKAQILIIEALINDTEFMLINFCITLIPRMIN